MNDFIEKWKALLVAALVAVASVGVTIVLTDDSTTIVIGRDASPAIPNTVQVDTADADNKKDTSLTLTPTAQKVAQSYVDNPKDLTQPATVPLAGSGVQKNVGEIPFPAAADELAPCRTRFLPTNYSSRGVSLSSVRAFELHYTAGPDIRGSRADVDGLTAFGSRAASRVSWHINMDKDGNCDYNVPLRLKAWTIAGLNPVTINIEVAGRGEAPYLRAGGYRALARIYKQIHHAYPAVVLRVATTDGHCHITRGGIGTHWMGGPCSGGHSDIKPLSLQAVIDRLKTFVSPVRPLAARWHGRCLRLNAIRARIKAGQHVSTADRAKAHDLRVVLEKAKLHCSGNRAVRS